VVDQLVLSWRREWEVGEVLSEIGLRLAPEKARVAPIAEGFGFSDSVSGGTGRKEATGD
jgi:hypothetical protein